MSRRRSEKCFCDVHLHVLQRALGVLIALVSCGMVGCGGTPTGEANAPEPVGDDGRPTSCPATAPAPHPLQGVRPEHRTAAFWVERARAVYGDPDAVLMSAADVDNHDRALELPVEDRPLGQIDLLAPVDEALLRAELDERLAYLKEKVDTATYLAADGEHVSSEVARAFAPMSALPALAPTMKRANGLLSLRCGPTTEAFYTESLDLAFDRNACSAVREGELVQVLATWPNGLLLARTPYALGFLAADAPLAPISLEAAEPLAHPPTRDITRRAVLDAAFALLDEPYGWGGYEGGRDCSRFLLDVFGSFGLGLPRHSARQALAGTFSIDVSEVTSAREKLLLLDTAAKKGIVLVHFPGHIMLYLGRTEDGTPMAIHSFSEYLEPCAAPLPDGTPGETLRRVDRVTVSDFSLGENTTRRSFLERMTRLTVIGGRAEDDLGGAATLRAPAPIEAPPETCDDSLDVAVFRAPAKPNNEQPLRVIITSTNDPGPVDLVVFDPEGARVPIDVHRLVGPPYTYWAEVAHPVHGRYTAVLADGTRVEACERIPVLNGRSRDREPATHAWENRWAWERDTENLYAAWVAQLFDYPIDEDLSWTNLQSLLQNRDNNLLHDYLSQGEDAHVSLEPDCADLPYFLRAYFAWKTGLPFAFRRCSRGRAGQPPTCNDLNTNLAPRQGVDDAASFGVFMRSVASGVHSASGRTAPNDDATDIYPVALDRHAILPGTVFADPYGHLLVAATWVPQGTTRYGVLIGADAQPDGTIGRRRFWRGSFLFTPSTDDVGAGFKAWRPLVYDRRAQTVSAVDNATLRRTTEHTPWSLAQYDGTADDFYDRMEGVINPRPLDAETRLLALVDALDESATRRILSVDNGVDFQNGRRWAAIEMPSGYDIFETTGPWEDFATPARDMRLLISIDAVRSFPDAVERVPEQFGLTAEEAAPRAAALRERLATILAERSFSYHRSDGSEQTLTLADVVARARDFEMSYNPNDCAEVRWSAPPDSDEMTTCAHHAPRDQRARMERYREWFVNRRRPPR